MVMHSIYNQFSCKMQSEIILHYMTVFKIQISNVLYSSNKTFHISVCAKCNLMFLEYNSKYKGFLTAVLNTTDFRELS